MKSHPQTAMVLAAGRGKRMRPLTAILPKPLVAVNGKPLIDHVLDRAVEAGVQKAVVNVHYLADLLEVHLGHRTAPEIALSDEREQLLETGGGIVKALPELGKAPFYIMNSDSLWLESASAELARLAEGFDEANMDGLLLLAPVIRSTGFNGKGDFTMDGAGHLQFRKERHMAPFAYTGFGILHPRLLAGETLRAFSLTECFRKAAEAGRLHGLVMDAFWMHVGTPDSIPLAEAKLRDEHTGIW